MQSTIRLCAALLFALLLCARAYAQTPDAVIAGSVRDQNGAAVAQANVVLSGPRTGKVVTDSHGSFSFENLPTGAYAIAVSRGGFEPAGMDGVRSGTVGIIISLVPATLSSIRQIAHVVSSARGAFNSSEAAQTFVNSSTLQAAGPSQVNHVLDQIPGVVSARSGSMNAAVPGALTSPNMRGALDYEKATLVDGHSMINGTRGDYPIMFVNGFLLDGIEVQQGPSANSPQINYAIGGTLNFRTAEPTRKPYADVLAGLDGWGGTYSNFRYSGTTPNGKLGYVFDYTTYGTPGALNNYAAQIALPPGSSIAGYGVLGATTSSTPLNGATGTYPIRGALGNPSNAYVTLVACCQHVTSNFLERGELAKIRYAFSGTTSAMVSYYGLQAQYDNTASSFSQLFSTFAPGTGYAPTSGAPASGLPLLLNSSTQVPSRTLLDNEPMLEAELRTAYHNDNVLARFYGAALDRFTVNPLAAANASYTTAPLALYGTAAVGGNQTIFTGQTAAVTIPGAYYNSSELDQLRGESFEYDHPIAANVLSFSFDRTTYLTNAYTTTGSSKNPSGNLSVLAPAGSRQDFSTYLLRGIWQIGPRTEFTLSNYFNVYKSTFTPAKNADGSYIFKTATRTHDDPRLGIAFHPSPDVSVRFETGSAVAPPYSALLDVVNQSPSQVYTPGATFVTVARNAGGLLPETSFGYDLGADWRLRNGAIVSGDAYLTNLRNQFVTTFTPDGTFTPPGSGTGIPVYVSTNANLGKARFEGVGATLSKDPPVGLGYQFSAALQRAYAYGIDPSFYATAAGPYTTNLGVVAGLNYVGFNPPFFNGISNKSEAYAQGYAQVHVRGSAGQYFALADTYYGPNNTYNVPAFFILSGRYRFNVAPNLALQISADNLLGTYGDSYIGTAAGIGAPLVNGMTGLRNAVPYGPTTLHIQIDHSL